MPAPSLIDRANAIRHFNRFYTRQIGALHEHLLESDYSLTEARILYELASRDGLTSADLCRELGLNAGYLSRVIGSFQKKGLVEKSRSSADARALQLGLTEQGRAVFGPLEQASLAEVTGMLERLSSAQQEQLLQAMRQVQSLLGERSTHYLLRDPQPGDMGWVVRQQTLLYAQEYGWNNEFEALVSEIVARFIRQFDPASDRCWIVEQDGCVVGSVFVVRQDEGTAQLRMLYVDASARGLGIGQRLVDECLRFARQAGYERMVLWTNSVLSDARRLYQKAGFELIREEQHHSFGKDLVGQFWGREL
ncbi:GNAT family N-acetyltransferase [Enterobacterales bacterium AE_CKDN230030158-1A_HGKHYDSX7]